MKQRHITMPALTPQGMTRRSAPAPAEPATLRASSRVRRSGSARAGM